MRKKAAMNSEVQPKPRNRKAILYIILAVFILLCVFLAFVLPRYREWLAAKRSVAAQIAISEIRKSVDNYWKSNGKMSGFKLEAAIQDAKLSKKILKNWQFVVVWKPGEIYTKELVDKLSNVQTNEYVYVAPFQAIFVTATKNNPLTAGTKVWFDGDANRFHGFGIDDLPEPDWSKIFPDP
jgi:hypothetical protein